MTKAAWYFDFISPFSYLQLSRFQDLPQDLEIALKPVVFAALLSHWGHVGPAEIPPKRQFVYRFFRWQANQRGMPFVMPPVHPFNPLPALRLALLGGSTPEVVRGIFNFIYGEGRNLEDETSITGLGASLGIRDAYRRISESRIKEQLKANTDEAIAAGVFGVPCFVAGGNLFWGDDATNMFLNYLREPSLFEDSEMLRISSLPMGITRPR
ncbi:MAG TPA: 2-hydroxychromene-2-carboxylate isomerase [Rhizomicrobium sp.]|jgi:2-hydroxychromene-2-carboxylate isomerase|nr:2-hydroxychromene-2-carboxylate isomerase [Rhizomicrobium sp.]